MSHSNEVVEVIGEVSYSPLGHCVLLTHSRSLVFVSGVDSSCEMEHTVAVTQILSVVGVGVLV